jgi:hypothetical protein
MQRGKQLGHSPEPNVARLWKRQQIPLRAVRELRATRHDRSAHEPGVAGNQKSAGGNEALLCQSCGLAASPEVEFSGLLDLGRDSVNAIP